MLGKSLLNMGLLFKLMREVLEATCGHLWVQVCLFSCSVMSDSLRPRGLYVARQAPPSMVFTRKEYWSGLLFPPPGIFPTQGSNPDLPHCREILYCLSCQGSWGKYEDMAVEGIHSKGEGTPGVLVFCGVRVWESVWD